MMTYERLLFFFVRVVRKSLRVLTGYRTPNDITHVCVTGKMSADELSLFIRKAQWYAPDKIIFHIKTDAKMPIPDNVQINGGGLCDHYLITKKRYIISNIMRLHRASIIDPAFYGTEECTAWSYLYGYAMADSTEAKVISENNFARMRRELSGRNRACCFLTGQSFDLYRDHPETKDMIKVICNSVVKNDEFMEFDNPDILCFADPVYHFSWNQYAEHFRRDVLKTVMKYGTYVMIPQNMTALMLKHFPQIKDRLIGVGRSQEMCFPTESAIKTFVTDNILTYLMLPAASAMAEEIYILGANGRSPGDKMFWKHNSSVQYDSLMQSVVDAHPSFFRDRNYVEYQEQHDKVMEELFSYGESRGKTYISLNGSYLKSINSRYKEEKNDTQTKTSE